MPVHHSFRILRGCTLEFNLPINVSLSFSKGNVPLKIYALMKHKIHLFALKYFIFDHAYRYKLGIKVPKSKDTGQIIIVPVFN